MDIADQAQIEIERDIENSLSKIKIQSSNETGFCHYCSDPIEKGHFCDSGCRDDSEALDRINSQKVGG